MPERVGSSEGLGRAAKPKHAATDNGTVRLRIDHCARTESRGGRLNSRRRASNASTFPRRLNQPAPALPGLSLDEERRHFIDEQAVRSAVLCTATDKLTLKRAVVR